MSDARDSSLDNYRVFSSENLIRAQRSSGYRNTAYAIAELVDNSIEAHARHVEILCQDRVIHVNERNRQALERIAILDDGDGMDPSILRHSLRFGAGTRARSKGIGKFGMGLPNSSISQCSKVEVYSWQGSSTPLYTKIDLQEIKAEDEVPKPVPMEIPSHITSAAKHFSKRSGTLVVWSKLDRCNWKTSRSLRANSESLLGRIYRKFIDRKQTSIRMASYIEQDGRATGIDESYVLPNDPMYLMSPSSTPEPYGAAPMFQKDGTKWEETFSIPYKDENHEVVVRYSIVRNEARMDDVAPGAKSYGKHAGRNEGVSIIRADRELDLDTNLVNTYNPAERWWGIEVEFPPGLDDILGLTNNKQGVANFSNLLKIVGPMQEDYTERELEDQLKEYEDATYLELFRMCKSIYSRKRDMVARNKTARQTVRSGGTGRSKSTDAIEDEERMGMVGSSDKDALQDPKTREEILIQDFVDDGIAQPEAEAEAKWILANKERAKFIKTNLAGSQFFDVQSSAGVLRIKINTEHPAYENLMALVDDKKIEGLSQSDQLKLAHDGLELLLSSWARLEDTTLNKEARTLIQDARVHWGEHLAVFFRKNKI